MKNLSIILAIVLLGTFSLNAQDWELDGNQSITPSQDFLGTTDNTPIPFRTSNAERMRLYPFGFQTIIPGGTGNTYSVNQAGFLGLGVNTNFFTGGSAKGPYSLLHLNGINSTAPQQTGSRDWMKYGISFTHNNDFMYVGPRQIGSEYDFSRAVISWSDNSGAGAGPDDFSFLFADNSLSNPSGDNECQEIMRLKGSGNVGIGNFQPNGLNEEPSHRLDVDGEVRIRDVNQFPDPASIQDCLLTGDWLGLPNSPDDHVVKRINFTTNSDEYLGGDGLWHSIDDSSGDDCDWFVNVNGDEDVYTAVDELAAWNLDCDLPDSFQKVIIGAQSNKEAKLYIQDDIGAGWNLDPEITIGVHARMAKEATLPNQPPHIRGMMGESVFFESEYNVGGEFIGRDAIDWNFGLVARATSDQLNGWGLVARNIGIYSQAIGSNVYNMAGYFSGDVYTTGAYLPSDEQLKENVSEVENALGQLNQLAPKNYNYLAEDFELMNLPTGIRYGFLAQELEQVYPNLVKQMYHPPTYNDEGELISPELQFKAINYIELIPILTAGIQEQQSQIESLNGRLEEMEAALADLGLGKNMGQSSSEAVRSDYELYQNRPNPFSTSTEIVWRMAEEAQARIIVQDEQGRTVATLQDGNMSKGLHSIEWQAADLPAGTYFYSLEVDGQLMVKRAIKLER